MENRLREPKVVAAAGYLLKSLPQRWTDLHTRRGIDRHVYERQQETWCCWKMWTRTAARDEVLLRDVNTYSSKRRDVAERCEHVQQ
jgi:hypothetical protein